VAQAVFGVQVPLGWQTLAMQTPLFGHFITPHLTAPLQPSGMRPQLVLASAQVLGVQPHASVVPPPPQVLGQPQLPHFNVPPQPSGTMPQLFASAEHVVGVQPQVLAVPPPPQVSGVMQLPHESVCEQPSETSPQLSLSAAQLVGMHVPAPQTLGTPAPPQLWPLGQPPLAAAQSSMLPQPSGIVPQFLPCAWQVVGVQPQTLAGPPPPHTFGGAQSPQLTMAPQPSATAPQFLPSELQETGVQPH